MNVPPKNKKCLIKIVVFVLSMFLGIVVRLVYQITFVFSMQAYVEDFMQQDMYTFLETIMESFSTNQAIFTARTSLLKRSFGE